MKRLYSLFIFIIFISPTMGMSSSWKIWITSETSVFQKNKDYSLIVSLTGYGQLRPSNIKMVVHTTPDVKLKSENMDKYFDTILLPFTKNAPDDIFTKRDNDIDNKLFLQVDRTTPFERLIFNPETTGDKYIDFFATYSSDGEEWNTIHSRYTFHVNSWYENHEIAIVIFTIIFGITTLVANIYILQKPITNLWGEIKENEIIRGGPDF